MSTLSQGAAICASDVLIEGGTGVRFNVQLADVGEAPAFVVRQGGKVFAYLNQCAHIAVELDWLPGQFFDDQGLYLVCATHGAMYEADTGFCVGGPCAGKSLTALAVEERDGHVYLKAD